MPDPSHEPRAGRPGDDDAAAAWEALRESLDFAAAGAHGGELRCVELCPICRAADILRAGGSPELRGQLSDLQREGLLTLRALIDHYIERLERPSDQGPGVEDIPID